jgi:hypothetical protein
MAGILRRAQPIECFNGAEDFGSAHFIDENVCMEIFYRVGFIKMGG